MPSSVAQQIASRTVQIAQFIGPRKTGRGLANILPVYSRGATGVEIPDKVSYMYYQDQGIKGYEMDDLSGRVIPIRTASGDIIFRRASPSTIGQRRIITRLPQTGQVAKSQYQWVYPNRDPLNFLGKSLELSIAEWNKTLTYDKIIQVLNQTPLKDDILEFFLGY